MFAWFDGWLAAAACSVRHVRTRSDFITNCRVWLAKWPTGAATADSCRAECCARLVRCQLEKLFEFKSADLLSLKRCRQRQEQQEQHRDSSKNSNNLNRNKNNKELPLGLTDIWALLLLRLGQVSIVNNFGPLADKRIACALLSYSRQRALPLFFSPSACLTLFHA